jgi:hypothetical protein
MVLRHLPHLVTRQPNAVRIYIKSVASCEGRRLCDPLQVPPPKQLIVANSGFENTIWLSSNLVRFGQHEPAATV